MSSTDDRRAAAAAFFTEKMVPVAEALRARGVRFFPLGPVPEVASWYVPSGNPPALEAIDPKQHAEKLRELWSGVPELAALAEPLMALAEQQRPEEDAQTGEVSPFVYVMF